MNHSTELLITDRHCFTILQHESKEAAHVQKLQRILNYYLD